MHVTGTNGKTSVARMIASLLVGSGLSAGTFTSPHLERVNERITWNNEPISNDALAELLTVMARARAVRRRPAELVRDPDRRSLPLVRRRRCATAAVVEVGVGGEWDSTNVVDGDVAVVTNVSVDHVEYLGPTRESIASEKAGIIKPGCTLVLGETDPALAPLFLDRGAERVIMRGGGFDVSTTVIAHGGRFVSFFTPEAQYDEIFLPLHGAHQADNAATALDGRRVLRRRTVRRGRRCGRVRGGAISGPARSRRTPPARVARRCTQRRRRARPRQALAEEFVAAPRTLVVGLLREKEPHEMLEALDVNGAHRVVCCRAPSPRALDPARVADAAVDLGVDPDRVDVTELVSEAVARGLAVTEPDGQLVVTGSLYTVGEARRALVAAGE